MLSKMIFSHCVPNSVEQALIACAKTLACLLQSKAYFQDEFTFFLGEHIER